MNKPMRRADRALIEPEARALLQKGTYGTLSTVGEDGQPYGTPLSYAAEGDSIYFHCAQTGHKLNNLRHQPQVCFSVVGKEQAYYNGDFTTRYESAVVFGTAEEVTDEQEKIHALRLICEKYLPEDMQHFDQAIAGSLNHTGVWKIRVQHMTGKARR